MSRPLIALRKEQSAGTGGSLLFTNYLNELAGTDIDFPVARHHTA